VGEYEKNHSQYAKNILLLILKPSAKGIVCHKSMLQQAVH